VEVKCGISSLTIQKKIKQEKKKKRTCFGRREGKCGSVSKTIAGVAKTITGVARTLAQRVMFVGGVGHVPGAVGDMGVSRRCRLDCFAFFVLFYFWAELIPYGRLHVPRQQV
jgi:hypothetical protein